MASTSIKTYGGAHPHWREWIKEGLNYIGFRTAEQPDYAVVAKEGANEVRDYRPFLTARIEVDGVYDRAIDRGFHALANYIFGENTRQVHMAMTAPVFLEANNANMGWRMSFVLPSKFTRNSLPHPLDHRILIAENPAELVASLRYSGGTDERKMRRKARKLEDWIESTGKWKIVSPPRSAQYDPPYVLPFLRRNEVQFTVVER